MQQVCGLHVKTVERRRKMKIVGTDEGALGCEEGGQRIVQAWEGGPADVDLVFHPKLVHSMK